MARFLIVKTKRAPPCFIAGVLPVEVSPILLSENPSSGIILAFEPATVQAAHYPVVRNSDTMDN
jgi:hypothetical protein